MPFELKNKAGETLHYDAYPASDFEVRPFKTETVDLDLPIGTMKATQWFFDGIKMTHSDSVLKDPITLDWKGDTEMISMCFNLRGKTSIIDAHEGYAFELSGNQHNMFYGQAAEGKMKVEDLRIRSFMIQLSKNSFFNIASEGNDAIKRFADKVATGRSVAFSETNLPIDLNLQRCIDAILHCNYAESLKRMFFFSKAIEMLVLQAESFDRACRGRAPYIKKEYDKERILFARDYLIKHLDCPPTLTELSRIAGINEFKLKKGFKEIFSRTVFEYLSDTRLEQARLEILENKKPLTEIAFQLGYSSLSHFSAAFKKKFGVAPGKAR